MSRKIKIKLESKRLSNYIKKLENEMYSSCDYDDKAVKENIKKLIIKLSLIDIALILAMVMIYKVNICMIVISIFLLYLINKTIIEKTFNNEKLKILYELPDFIDEIKSGYYEKRMIDEALLSAITSSPYEIAQRGRKMLMALQTPNTKLEVEKYNRECNNKYLKLLMNILYITKEYGDKNDSFYDKDNKKEQRSVFIKNLNHLLEDVNIEITKQNLFKSKFQGLLFATVFPLLFINLVEKWSVSNFEVLGSFYNSYAGFILKNVSVLVSIFMSILIIKIKDSELNIEIAKNKFNEAKDDLIKNKYENLVNKLIPNKSSKQYNILLKKLDDAKIEMNVEGYYKDKIKYFVLSLIFLTSMFLEANTYLDVLSYKVILLELLIVLLLSFTSIYIVDFNMNFLKHIKKSDRENEINSFRSIILILIHYPFVSCEEILLYLEKYSYIYKNEIKRCINDYEGNAEYALEKAKNEVEEKGLKKIFRCLLQCVKNIKVQQAFSFLETEREFYKEETKNNNIKVVNEKTNLAQLISTIPYYTLVILYFIVPMVVTGINELGGLIEQVKNI